MTKHGESGRRKPGETYAQYRERSKIPSGMVTGYTSSNGMSLYTDGERFNICINGFTPECEKVTLTKDEMKTVLRTFAPYFSGHDFGPVGDIWEDG